MSAMHCGARCADDQRCAVSHRGKTFTGLRMPAAHLLDGIASQHEGCTAVEGRVAAFEPELPL